MKEDLKNKQTVPHIKDPELEISDYEDDDIEPQDTASTKMPSWFLNMALILELVAIGLFICGNKWIPATIRDQLPLGPAFILAHLLRAFAESVLLIALTAGLRRRGEMHPSLVCAIIFTAAFHIAAAMRYFSSGLESIEIAIQALSYASALFFCLGGIAVATSCEGLLKTAGGLMVVMALTGFQMKHASFIAMAFGLFLWVVNKIIAIRLFITLRKSLIPFVPEKI